MNVQTMSPQEIDEALAALYATERRVESALAAKVVSLHRMAGMTRYDSRKAKTVTTGTADEALAAVRALAEVTPRTWKQNEADKLLDAHAATLRDLHAARDEAKVYNAEFTRRGGWSRFFLVTSSDGHIHSSMRCSTCQWSTEYGWLPSVSGKTEAEAVAEHGALLCSVCYPSAPVEWRNGREVEQAAKDAGNCPGSGTWDYPRETARLGYYTGNYGICTHCGEGVTVTSTGKMRKHKPKTT